MNGYQRALLLAGGGLIAFLQYLAIEDEGFSENRGWATGFLIAVMLLFLGLTSNDTYRRVLSRFKLPTNRASGEPGAIPHSAPSRASATKAQVKPPFERALNEQILFATQQGLWKPQLAQGKNLKWCAIVAFYCNAKMANADGSLEPELIIWNSLVHRLTIEMLGDCGVGMGDADYGEAEADAYSALHMVDILVRDGASWERLAGFCANLYGCTYDAEKVKGLTEFLIERAHRTKHVVLPSFLSAFQ